MKANNALLCAYKLLLILQFLYKSDLSKSEIKEQFENSPIKNISDESIKLYINTLIEAGFVIERGTRKNNYRYHLDKKFVRINFAKSDFNMLFSAKNMAIEFLSYKQIINLQKFYKRLAETAQDPFETGIFDFKIFDRINPEIVLQIEEVIERKLSFYFIYDSPSRGPVEMEATPYALLYRNYKLYMECSLKNYSNIAILRVDNIEKITKILSERDENIILNKRCKANYVIKKDFLKTHFLEDFEKIIKYSKETVEILADDADEFFIVQRLLTLGKNCIAIKTNGIKEKVLEKLTETLESYRECH